MWPCLLFNKAKKCFEYGLNLAQIRVIPDDKSEIMDCIKRIFFKVFTNIYKLEE